MRRKIIFVSALVTIGTSLFAQVNMNSGTLNFDVPVYSYADNVSGLSLKTSLSYTSGNGLKIDEVSNCIGTGWELMGVAVVSRIVRGLPDDQLEKTGNVFDTSKYPPGYLYNNFNISSGCPVALTKYPIFHSQNVWYDDDNRTLADRELDNFQVMLNGRTCSFVIDKNWHALALDDSRLKIEIITEDQRQASHIRTSIKEFDITDENGIKYIFSETEIVRLYKTMPPTGGIFTKETDIPLNQDPYVIMGWYVSKILDIKSGRFIAFSYNTTAYRYQAYAGLKTEILNCPNPNIPCGIAVAITDPANNTYTIHTKTDGVIKKTEILKKEISSINFPDEFSLDFSYTVSRKDIAGTIMLNSIAVKDNNQQLLLKYSLEHSYFIKNEIRMPANADEERWSRLCLTSIRKTGVNEVASENPWKFDYYQGTNATEDFVAPYFFQAKDPWGYYNGSYAGIPTDRFLSTAPLPGDDYSNWTKVCLYNQAHDYPGAIEIFYNCKNNYAKNGLLKKVTNPFGGATEYQYEQNYYATTGLDEMYSFDHLPNGDISVGGVHLSKIIQKRDNDPANDIITAYTYTDDQGKSTRWGEEALKFSVRQRTFWQAAEKYFPGNSCKYYYIYPGSSFVTSNPENLLLAKTFAVLRAYNQIRYVLNPKTTKADIRLFIINNIATYVESILISCLPEPPSKSESHVLLLNDQVNGNLLPRQYKRVIEKTYSGSNLQSGKTIYEFTSPDDFPLILPNSTASYDNKPRGYLWVYGLTKSVKYYDNTATLVKSTENEYALKKNDVQDINTRSCNCQSYYQESLRSDQWNTANTFNEFTTANLFNNSLLSLKVDFYNLVAGHSELKTTTEKLFNHSGQAIATATNYTYDPANNLLATQSSVNSTGILLETRNYYLEDYDLSTPANIVLKQMKNDHILNVPVSSEAWQTKPGAVPEMLNCLATEYGISPSGTYRPIKTYAFQNDKPLPENVIGQFDPSKLVRNSSFIKPVTETTYDQYFGEPLQIKDIEGNRLITTIYGTANRLPIASVTNASKDEIAYTSFELDEGWYTGNWSNVNVEILKEPSPTGDYCGHLINGSTVSAYIPVLKDYKLTFWSSSASFSISGNPVPSIVGPTISGWTYYEFDLHPWLPYINITGNCKMDELRLYPKNANMSTTTYRPGIGKISSCDGNNRIAYYEYDEQGRISKLLDERHNIIKTYEYHFKN